MEVIYKFDKDLIEQLRIKIKDNGGLEIINSLLTESSRDWIVKRLN